MQCVTCHDVDMDYRAIIGERVRTAIKKKGITQGQAARAAGCSRQAISNVINRRAALSFYMARLLQENFGVDANELLELQFRYQHELIPAILPRPQELSYLDKLFIAMMSYDPMRGYPACHPGRDPMQVWWLGLSAEKKSRIKFAEKAFNKALSEEEIRTRESWKPSALAQRMADAIPGPM